MSRSKVSILSKYVMAIAILALLFSVAITSARYAVESYGSSSIGIESFDVDVKLLDENRNEVSGDITLDDTTEDLSSYTKVYYLYINNNDIDTLYYKIEEQSGNFCFKVGEDTTRYTTYGGSLDATTSTELTLTLSVRPDVTINTGETQSLSISLYAEYQHTEAYESEEVEEPEPELDDENHPTADGWIGLSSSNINSALNGSGKYYLSENISVSSTLTLASGSTLCLNGHTLTGTSSLNPLISVTSGNVTIEDCQGGGSISGASRGVSVANGATLTLEGKPTISSNTTNVYLESGAYISLGELEEGASIGVTSATSITGSNSVQISSTETGTYHYESAIKYIHSDISSYKVAGSHSGYLKLIGIDYVNLSIALEGTNNSKPGSSETSISGNDYTFNGTYYINGVGDWSRYDSSSWVGNAPLTTYSGSGYNYDMYYDFGSNSVNSNYDFLISPSCWVNSAGYCSLGPISDAIASPGWNGTYQNFNIWGTQGFTGSGTWTSATWTLEFANNTYSLASILQGVGDLTVVFQANFSTVITNDHNTTNNVISGIYFIVDGKQVDLNYY